MGMINYDSDISTLKLLKSMSCTCHENLIMMTIGFMAKSCSRCLKIRQLELKISKYLPTINYKLNGVSINE